MLIRNLEIGRTDFPNRDTLESTHRFLPNKVWMEFLRNILQNIPSNPTPHLGALR